MKNKVIAVLLCFMLIFSCFFMNTLHVDAFAQVVVASAVVMAAILVAFGYDACEEGFEEFCTAAYESLSESQQSMLATKALAVAYLGKGIGEITFSESEWDGVIDWYNINNTWLNSEFTYGQSAPDDIDLYTVENTTTNTYALQIDGTYNSLSGNKILIYGSNLNQQRYIQADSIGVQFDSSTYTVRLLFEGNVVSRSNYNTGLNSISNAGGTTSNQHILSYSGNFNIIDSSNNVIGTFSTGISTLLTQLSLFNPTLNPVWPSVDGDYRLHVPVAETPTSGIDEGIDMPSTTADNPISLDDVINMYGSLQEYFDAGNVITLADGTTLSGTNEYTRAADTATMPDVTSGTDIAADVGIIGNILSYISTLIQTIADAISKFFNVSDFTLDLDPLKVNFKDKFPFCIPFDFANLITIFSAEPEDFSFRINVMTSYWTIDHTVDLSAFQFPIMFFRYVVIAFFVYILINKTHQYIKW